MLKRRRHSRSCAEGGGMSANLPVHEDELHAYADNQLAPTRAEEVGAVLAREPALAASLFLGVGVGWFGRGEMLQLAGTPVTFPRQAALTHVLYASDANRPVEVWAAEEQRLVNWS